MPGEGHMCLKRRKFAASSRADATARLTRPPTARGLRDLFPTNPVPAVDHRGSPALV